MNKSADLPPRGQMVSCHYMYVPRLNVAPLGSYIYLAFQDLGDHGKGAAIALPATVWWHRRTAWVGAIEEVRWRPILVCAAESAHKIQVAMCGENSDKGAQHAGLWDRTKGQKERK